MLKAAVVEDHVHDHLQPFGMCLVAELAVVVVGAEAGIYTVVVRRGIAVVGCKTVVSVGGVVL